MNHSDLHVSIVIPVYNEEEILEDSVIELIEDLKIFQWEYEIILAENGSKDDTIKIGKELSNRYPQVSIFSASEPNYGKALREGILKAKGEFVISDEIDLCDVDFYRRAITILETQPIDLVVGSKTMAGANDDRPIGRHLSTLVLNTMLRVSLGFKGTDTHGLKAFRREALLPIVNKCLVDKDLFASEFVIRAERNNIPIQEIPIQVVEKRAPSIGLIRRVPNVLKNMAKLVYTIRFKS